MSAKRNTYALVALASLACGQGAPPPASAAPAPPVAAAPPPRLVPAPGADLEGPPPAPAASPRRAGTPGEKAVVDLGSDRPVGAVTLPAPPRGGAAPFTFGDDRRGWVARIPEANQLPSVAYGDGRVFVSGGFESVSMYALDASDGHVVWASQALEDNGPTAPTYQDGKLLFNTESCTLFVVDARTGKKLWFKYLGDPTLTQPSANFGLVFAAHPASGGEELSAYRLKDGELVWSAAIAGELRTAPILSGDSVFISTTGGGSYRFRAKTGEQVWAKQLDATSAPWVVGDKLFLSRTADDKETQIVVSAETGKVLKTHQSVKGKYLADVPHDTSDWKKVWAFEGSRPAVVNGVRYVAMGGLIQASDPETGEALWTRRYAAGVDKRSLGTVAVAGAQVVVATRTGDLYGLDIDTGYTLWAYGIGKHIVAQPIVAKGWVYATTTDGEVVALNVADSTLDGWHMWGGNSFHTGLVPAPAEPPSQHASR